MPSRQSKFRTRSPDRHRSWGTRYDKLVSPPPKEISSVPSSPSLSTSSPPSDAVAKAGVHTASVNIFDATASPSERRDWADDEVPFTLGQPHSRTDSSTAGGTPGPERLPHSASIFVGSLPPDANESEVAQPLREHLSTYASIREVKIIRDSKGGLCAFVQCESPAQAVQLLSQAQANSRPFMGRILRFETARARRTLWVSYKTPKQFIPCTSIDDKSSDFIVDRNGVKGRWVQTELPDAIRISKPPQARFPVVTYGDEARRGRDRSSHDSVAISNCGQAFTLDGLYLPKLKFDAQTVHIMAEAFGPLEHFRVVFSSATTTQKGMEAIPLEHRARRSVDMDTAIWEVKWGHREDSISAFNTMKSVPHLVVTWARESSMPGFGGDFSRSPVPFNNLMVPSPLLSSPSSIGRRPLLLMDSQKRGGAEGDSPSCFRELGVGNPRRRDESDDGWTLVRSQSHGTISAVLPTANDERVDSPALTNQSQRSPEWKEGDFPPLDSALKRMNLRKDDTDGTYSPRSHQQVSGEPEKVAFPSTPTPGIIASFEDETAQEAEKNVENAIAPRPRAVHRRSLSNPIGRTGRADPTKQSETHYIPATQALEIPPAPDLSSNPAANTPASMHLDPPIPVNAVTAISQSHVLESDQKANVSTSSAEDDVKIEGDHFRRQAVDTKAIFVGGLDVSGPDAWSEGRLRAVFGKHGQITEVRLVMPNESKKTAFAFITFSDEEGPVKSIRYENNKTYHHRPIRVQMRDINPPRYGYRSRGRGQGRRPNYEPRMFSDFRRQQGSIAASSNSNEGSATADNHAMFNFGSAHIGPANSALSRDNVVHSHPSQSNSAPYASARLDESFHHEFDNNTPVSLTPPPSQHSASYSSSAEAQTAPPLTPVSALSAPHTVGFNPPHGWPAAYTTPFGYPITYGSYGGAIPHGVMPVVPMHANSSQSNEGPVSPNTAVPAWGSIYPYVPYQYFVVPTPQAINPALPSSAPSQASSPGKNQSQPPLIPTQLIQGEHGTLIPVYHPQALSDYMGPAPVYGIPERRLSASTPSGPNQSVQTYSASHSWSTAPPPVLAIQIPTQRVTSSQPLTPSHVQQPPDGGNIVGTSRGTISAGNSSSSIVRQHLEPQRSIPQQATSQTLPMHGGSLPTHNSLSSIPASGRTSLPKMPTSFSLQSIDAERSNASYGHRRRCESFSFGKPGPGSNNAQLGRSPSAVRIGHGPPSVPMNAAQSAQNMGNFPMQQYTSLPQHPQSQARPLLPNLQIGFSNVSNNDNYPQMHWMANHPQQHQQ